MPHGSKTMLSSIFFHLFVYGLFWALILLADLPVPAIMLFSRRSFQPPASWGWSLHHESSSNCRSCSQGNQKAWLPSGWSDVPLQCFSDLPRIWQILTCFLVTRCRQLCTIQAATCWPSALTRSGCAGQNAVSWFQWLQVKIRDSSFMGVEFYIFYPANKGSNDWLYIMMVSWFSWLNWTLPDPLKKSLRFPEDTPIPSFNSSVRYPVHEDGEVCDSITWCQYPIVSFDFQGKLWKEHERTTVEQRI